MGRTASTEPQCLYKGALYAFFTVYVSGYTQTDPTRMLSPNNVRLSGANRVGFFFEPTVWPDACCSVHRIRVFL